MKFQIMGLLRNTIFVSLRGAKRRSNLVLSSENKIAAFPLAARNDTFGEFRNRPIIINDQNLNNRNIKKRAFLLIIVSFKHLVIGVWNLFGIWRLALGIFGNTLKKARRRGEIAFIAGNSAFTIIEALVVIVIFSILSASISASFISGMKVWSRAKNVTGEQMDVLINLEKISSELRQIVTIPQIDYQGDSTRVSFARAQNNSIYKVSYIFDAETKILSRGQVDLKYILEGKEEENFVEKDLIYLDEFLLSYLYWNPDNSLYEWKDTWEPADGRFLAVKIQEKLKNEEFKRAVFIP